MTEQDEQLMMYFQSMSDHGQQTLLEFAEFLQARHPRDTIQGALPAVSPVSVAAIPEPEEIPRPEKESVVGAMKRLSKSYYMVDKGKLLDKASSLMTEHMMQGRDAVEVIDELEIVFRLHYEEMSEKGSGD